MRVTVVEYSPGWREKFERERELLTRVVGADAGIVEHVGSTSVEGLAAKPIIDIMIGLHDFSAAADFVPGIQGLGYEYVPEHEAVMPERRYFRKRAGGVTTHHVHMVQAGGEFWRRHLLFRDYLRANPDAVAAYAALKKELARREWGDKGGYTDAKTAFIREVEERAAAGAGGRVS
jgi:GrpB-like predicted nucleotidyltransferase (UPF0157 family)